MKRPTLLVPKRTGRMLVKKGPPRSVAHLMLVRAQPCLRCGVFGNPRQDYPTEAHHPRELVGSMLGKRISDFFALPLCTEHHSDQFPDGLHRVNNASWWDEWCMPGWPLGWLSRFLAKHYSPGTNAGVDAARAEIGMKLGRYRKETEV